jgi:hypothetical protein
MGEEKDDEQQPTTPEQSGKLRKIGMSIATLSAALEVELICLVGFRDKDGKVNGSTIIGTPPDDAAGVVMRMMGEAMAEDKVDYMQVQGQILVVPVVQPPPAETPKETGKPN